MEYLGVGYSNIRIPDKQSNYAYKYNYRYNSFPEEVYVHEFLHTLERNAKTYGFEVPDLHDYSKYGYVDDSVNGQRDWYVAYMNKEIQYGRTYIGLPPEVYIYKPIHESNFKYSNEVNALQEPKNIIEVIRSVARRVGQVFTFNRDEVVHFNSAD